MIWTSYRVFKSLIYPIDIIPLLRYNRFLNKEFDMPAKDYKDAAKVSKSEGDMIMYNQYMYLYHDELKFNYAERKCEVGIFDRRYGRYVELCNKHVLKSVYYWNAIKLLGGVPEHGIDRTGSLSARMSRDFAANVTTSQV